MMFSFGDRQLISFILLICYKYNLVNDGPEGEVPTLEDDDGRRQQGSRQGSNRQEPKLCVYNIEPVSRR